MIYMVFVAGKGACMVKWHGRRVAGRGVAAVLALALAACATSPPRDFVEQEMSGQIAGKEWLYKHAYIDPTIETPQEDDLVIVFLPYVPSAPCPKESEASADQRSVMVSVPKGKKVIKLKKGRNLVFQYVRKGEAVANIAKRAKVRLTDIGTTKISGKVFAQYNGSNWVSGNFKAVLCEFGDLQ